ncbi:hypothetical protein GCM10027605_28620 [Micromonospora zhanjiangensis]
MPHRARHQLRLGVVVEAVGQEVVGRLQRDEVVGGVVEATGVLYGYAPAVVAVAVDNAGQPAFDRVVEPDPALADELEQHHRSLRSISPPWAFRLARPLVRSRC